MLLVLIFPSWLNIKISFVEFYVGSKIKKIFFVLNCEVFLVKILSLIKLALTFEKLFWYKLLYEREFQIGRF